MIDPKHELPITHQARLLALARSSVYYASRPVPEIGAGRYGK